MSPNLSLSGSTGLRSGSRMTGGSKDIIPKGYQKGQLGQFTPEQMQLFQRMFGNVGQDSFLSKLAGGDESQFEQLEAPALRQFQGLQGQLASRFSGMGNGARRSSGFQNTMNSAGSDFAQQLQSQRLGLQRQAMQDLMGMSESLLSQRPYEQFLTKKEQPFWQKLLLGISEAGAGAAGNYFGSNLQNRSSQRQPSQQTQSTIG
jgi:hypothetical protein